MANTSKKLAWTIKEAAQVLGVHPNTLYRLVWRGELRAARVGARLLIAKSELERLLGAPMDEPPHQEAGEK